ncbi:MAG: phospho-N-acetylmuramoyl-pentapeptide-transferase [Firmicutes bacterium HGW-Firmicutes-9]|jgi:phospho-N-acetylmuramoyl-pentapeptide-transferase|nr:MAG: phospho-N-acetylmuramoyl-pentapeptide-transferase [Firmicutes bacterium HGW-Firmicutes-9]
MLYSILPISHDLTWMLISVLVAFILTFVAIKVGIARLPKDQGRKFAVNGELAKGKPRGAGLIFSITSVLVFLLFVPFRWEYAIYCALFLLEMLSGYLDDRSSASWSEWKKGLLDLVVCLAAAGAYLAFNESNSLSLFGWTLVLPPWVFLLVATFVLWISINFTNCTDGVDGLLGSVSIVSLATFAAIFLLMGNSSDLAQMCFILVASLLAYLLFNASPSLIIMGDAGSRMIGIFLGIMALKTYNLLYFIPVVLVIILDGGIGLFKLLFIRLTKIKGFLKSVRTPLHDHARKNMGWSDTQVGYRFAIIQLLASGLCIAALLLRR